MIYPEKIIILIFIVIIVIIILVIGDFFNTSFSSKLN